nr:hypothetical protein [Armatimonas sp.]
MWEIIFTSRDGARLSWLDPSRVQALDAAFSTTVFMKMLHHRA